MWESPSCATTFVTVDPAPPRPAVACTSFRFISSENGRALCTGTVSLLAVVVRPASNMLYLVFGDMIHRSRPTAFVGVCEKYVPRMAAVDRG